MNGNNDMAGRPSLVLRDRLFSEESMGRRLREIAAAERLEQTARAIVYAAEKHAGQYRKKGDLGAGPGGPDVGSDGLRAETGGPGGRSDGPGAEAVPYIVHPYIMACHAHALGIRDDEVLAACLLHDVSEDCGIAPEELPFGEGVRRAVALLTKREPVDTAAYYAAIGGDSTAAIVKALDRCSNVSTMMTGFTQEKIVEYVDETETYVIPLLDRIKEDCPQYRDAVFVIKYQILSILESAKAAVLRQEAVSAARTGM